MTHNLSHSCRAWKEEGSEAHVPLGMLADRAKTVPDHSSCEECADSATLGTNYGLNLVANASHLGMTGVVTEGSPHGRFVAGSLSDDYGEDVDPEVVAVHGRWTAGSASENRTESLSRSNANALAGRFDESCGTCSRC